MPSQEEYLDNLLKGIETENMETAVTKEPKMTGTEEELPKHRKRRSLWKRLELRSI